MKKAILLLTVLFLIVSLSACDAIKDKIVSGIKSAAAEVSMVPDATEKADEPTAEPEETVTADESSKPDDTQVNSSSTNYWVEGIPGYVPKFSYGSYQEKDSGKMEFDGSLVVTMNFDGVTAEQMDEYCAALKIAGFEVSKVSINDELMIATSLKKDNKECALLIGWKKAGGICNYVLTLTEEKK